MSYSDYGGYAWKKLLPDGPWERFKDAEDGTLIGILAPQERPLEKATGVKFDVLINAYQKQGVEYGARAQKEKEVDWLTGHPHHCVIGGMSGLGLVGHKQDVIVTWDGKEIARYPDYGKILNGNPTESSAAKARIEGRREGYIWSAEYIEYPHSTGCLMLLYNVPEKTATAGVVGYGVGHHWWRDSEGYEWFRPGDRFELFREVGRDDKGERIFERKELPDVFAVTEEELDKLLAEGWMLVDSGSSEAAKADIERFNLFGDDAHYQWIKRKPKKPWPLEKDWAERVQAWADVILRNWTS